MADYILIGYTFGIIKYCSTRFTSFGVGFFFPFYFCLIWFHILDSISFVVHTRALGAHSTIHAIFSCNFKSGRICARNYHDVVHAWGVTRYNCRIYTGVPSVGGGDVLCLYFGHDTRPAHFYFPIVCRLHVTHVCLCDNHQKISGFVFDSGSVNSEANKIDITI